MKEYKKPAMMALSLSANDALCSTCTIKTRFPELDGIADWLNKMYGGEDNLLTPTDKYFAMTENCEEKVDFDDYCKFTTNDTGATLFTS